MKKLAFIVVVTASILSASAAYAGYYDAWGGYHPCYWWYGYYYCY